MSATMVSRIAVGAIVLASAIGAQAQFFPGGFYGGFNSPSNNPNGYGFGPFRGGPSFDIGQAMHVRSVHGILAALAFVILLPGGAILMRLLPGRLAVWVHAAAQIVAYCIFIGAAALGFVLINEVNIPFQGGTLLTNTIVRHHPIIGIVVLVALFFQPILGTVHHLRFKKLQRRGVWSHLHIWNGRIMITLGIINGGIGLYLAGATTALKTAYGVVAGVMWVLWMLLAIFGELRRVRSNERKNKSRGSGSPRRKLSEGD